MSVDGEFKRLMADDRLCTDVLKAVRDGDAEALRRLGFGGFAQYAGRLSELMTASVLDELEFSDDFGALMRQVNSPARYAHHLVNEAGTAVQTALDEKNGVRLRAVQPPYNDGRTKGLIGDALSRETPEQGKAALATGLGTAVKDAGNAFLKANAEQRSRAGFTVMVERSGGSKCCPWCADRIGKWELKNAPKDVFGCHDNCTCMVSYTNSRGVKTQRSGKGRFVEVNYQPHVLTDGEKRGAGEPKRLTGGITSPTIGDGSKFYRKVELESKKVQTIRKKGSVLINASPVLNSKNKLFVSDSIAPKPKLIHQVDNALTEVLQIMGIADAQNLPDIYIISDEEMAKNAVAAYRAADNKLFVNAPFAFYTRDKMPKAMEDFVNPEDYRSTYIHELYHWLDAQEYREKVGAITEETYYDYNHFVQEKAKKALDKLVDSGYNILGISNYASISIKQRKYDETYAEYRTKIKLMR